MNQGLIEAMKYNIDSLSTLEKLGGSFVVMILGIVTCIVVLAILILFIRIMSVAFNDRKKADKSVPSAPASPAAPAAKPASGGNSSVSAIAMEDENELVAVITAAIESIRGRGNFVIRNIIEKKNPPANSNWVTTGRFEAFQSRKVTRK